MAVQTGIVCKMESDSPKRASFSRLFDGGCAVLLYAALWGGLCSMAALSDTGALPLALGGLFALSAAVTDGRRGGAVLAIGVSLVAILLLVRWQTWLDGGKLFLNRLFAASEGQQAYTYVKFLVGAEAEDWRSCIQYCLAPVGVLAGLVCGAVFRRRSRLLLAGLVLLFAGTAAYLGISPGLEWNILLAAVLVLSLWERPAGGTGTVLLGGAGSLLALALVCAGVLVVLPGEDTRLSAWDEQARDILALRTVAYDDLWEPQAEQETRRTGEEKEFYQEEETAGALDGGEAEWLKPLSAVLAILLFALLLFLPAFLSDLQKRRRAKNRAGLDDPDCGASIRAMFLYTLRWMYLGGLTPANVPFSGYAGQIGVVFSQEIRAGFESVLPLWQEAAYSTHRLDETRRMQMRRFMEATRQSVWDGLGRKKRLLAKYIYAL